MLKNVKIAYNPPMAIMITLLSTKGGVGKTVTAVHLAAYCSSFGRTLLVDGDATRSATLWSRPGRLPFPVVPERGLAKELSEHRYDFLVMDTEANPEDDDFRELASSSNLVIIPSVPDALGLQGAQQTAEKLRRAGSQTPFRILLTIVPPRPNRDGEDAMEYLVANELPHFKVAIRRAVAFPRAIIEGVTVDRVDRSNLGWRDYERVGEEVFECLKIHIAA